MIRIHFKTFSLIKRSVPLMLGCFALFCCGEDKQPSKPKAYWRGVNSSTGLSINLVHDVMIASDGKLWAAFYEGVVGRLDGGAWTMLDPLPDNNEGRPYELFEDRDGNIWVTVYHDGKTYASKFDGASWKPYYITNNRVTAITQMPDGNIFFASDGGGYFLDGETITKFDCGGLCYRMYSAVVDNDGVLWIGKDRNGIIKMDGSTATELNIPLEGDDRFGSEVADLVQGSSGDIIASLSPGTAWRFRDGKWQRIVTDTSYPAGPAEATLEDSKGRVWIGTQDKGVVLVDGKDLITYTLNNKKNNITAIVEDANGEVFLGNSNGLWQYGTY